MIRVLHIVGKMDRAGTETWLLNVLKNTNRHEISMDFLVHDASPGEYDREIYDLGAKIICLPISWNLIKYFHSLYRILKGEFPYDVIHSHVHHFSGFTLSVARLANTRIRIAHCHNDTSMNDISSSFARRFYLKMMEFFISKSATKGLAASELAALSLFGKNWRDDGRWNVLYCGIDFELFAQSGRLNEASNDCLIPAGRFVVGHVGRFVEQKNHKFLIAIFEEILKIHSNSHLLLVGVGPLLEQVKKLVVEKQLESHVTFAGSRSDVAELMKNVMEVFVFPSTHEGLGLVLVEAQAARIPCIISDVIPNEVAISNVAKVSLNSLPSVWAKQVFLTKQKDLEVSEEEKEQHDLLKRRFSIASSIESLKSIYKCVSTRSNK